MTEIKVEMKEDVKVPTKREEFAKSGPVKTLSMGAQEFIPVDREAMNVALKDMENIGLDTSTLKAVFNINGR